MVVFSIFGLIGKRLVGDADVIEPVGVLFRLGECRRGLIGLKRALPKSGLGIFVAFFERAGFACQKHLYGLVGIDEMLRNLLHGIDDQARTQFGRRGRIDVFAFWLRPSSRRNCPSPRPITPWEVEFPCAVELLVIARH